jgi:hypothetical protein
MNVYSKQFISQAGLSGTGTSVVVPAGRIYLVRFVSVYCNSPSATISVFFQDDVAGTALLNGYTGDTNPIRIAQDCRFVFTETQAFHFQVDVEEGFTGAADVSAAGYDLVAP